MIEHDWLFGYDCFSDPAWQDPRLNPEKYLNYEKFREQAMDIVEMFGREGSEHADPEAPEIYESDIPEVYHRFLAQHVDNIIRSCKDLMELRDTLKHLDTMDVWLRLQHITEVHIDYDISDLPIYGNNPIVGDTTDIYSWDDDCVLTQVNGIWTIEDRKEFEQGLAEVRSRRKF